MVTVLCFVYTALVVLLFKFKLLKPRPYPLAWVARPAPELPPPRPAPAHGVSHPDVSEERTP
jgi:hypothetical protein